VKRTCRERRERVGPVAPCKKTVRLAKNRWRTSEDDGVGTCGEGQNRVDDRVTFSGRFVSHTSLKGDCEGRCTIESGPGNRQNASSSFDFLLKIGRHSIGKARIEHNLIADGVYIELKQRDPISAASRYEVLEEKSNLILVRECFALYLVGRRS